MPMYHERKKEPYQSAHSELPLGLPIIECSLQNPASAFRIYESKHPVL